MVRIFSLIVLLLTLRVAPALAQTPEEIEKAAALFDAAETLYQIQDYEKALALYKEAYVLSKAPELLFNLGQCYRFLGKKDEAIRAYNNFLRSLPEDSPLRAEVQPLIELAEKIPDPVVVQPKERVRVFDLPTKELARVFLLPEILTGSFIVLGSGSLAFNRVVQKKGSVPESLRYVGFASSLAADLSWIGAIATFGISYKKKNDELRLAVDPVSKSASLSLSFRGLQ